MSTPVLHIFGLRVTYKHAFTICDSLGGHMPLPQSQVLLNLFVFIDSNLKSNIV